MPVILNAWDWSAAIGDYINKSRSTKAYNELWQEFLAHTTIK